MVHKSLIPIIKDFKDVNPIISVLTLSTQWFDISFINLHVHTEDKQQKEDLLYEDVITILNTILKSKIQIILVDFNVKIGRKRSHSDQ